MGSVTPGSGGTLKSVTIENALYEALTLASNWESDVLKNPTLESKIAIQTSFATKTLDANFTFKLEKSFSTTDATSFPVVTQLIGTNYSAGTGGTIVAPNIYAAIVRICEEIQNREASVNKNPLTKNSITVLNYASETLTVTGSINMSLDFTTDSTGSVVSRARTYLLD